ncbi:MAG: NADH-quinone oxidoreductase subunit L [SAR202 cluster bacterium Io17-Chloro-G2]|nr:MAG: NADH-quinone oxidoreductase subunit L [SAR202 cluster bacterium Io17-Chloro-G2]
MVGELAVWGIFLLPLASFVIIAVVIRPFLNRFSLLSGLLLIGALAVALWLSIDTLASVVRGHEMDFGSRTWLQAGGATIEIGLLVDPLTAIMLVVVTSVSLLVQIYSLGYMNGDPGFSRYYAYMALFTASMLGVVLASNVIQLYAFWELVGVSSYLLIGFWHERPAAAAAAKKAFIVTRIGDVGFLIAILYLFFQADKFAAQGLNAFHIPDIWQAAQPVALGGLGILAGTGLTWFSLGIFAGAAGKSGQFPLHTWLPDAMEGPTPVSALIHAATMVAAGVFLVARFYPVFQVSAQAMTVVALIGAFTALMAATMGLVMNDIKRVMAYSTISQLGYMMAALGMGLYGAAIFHLFTHAAFKALLFLGAGSVNHTTGTFNMRYMGGLRRQMPYTYWLVVIGGLSLVGIVPLAGFWSKDEILLGAWNGNVLLEPWVGRAVVAGLLAGVALTGFYTLRMIFMTFHGEYRGGIGQEMEDAGQPAVPAHAGQTGNAPRPDSGDTHLHESPWVMVAPMLALGIGAVLAGFLANPQWFDLAGIPKHWITEFLIHGMESNLLVGVLHFGTLDFNPWMALASTAIALAGVGVAYLLYGIRSLPGRDPLERAGPVHRLLTQKYYLDALYEGVAVRRIFYRAFAGSVDWLERNLVDGAVDLLGWVFRNFGPLVLSRLQTGQVQTYGAVVALGGLAIFLGFLLR